MKISIRKGIRQDLPRVLALIRELAEYERAPEEVINTVELMETDGFGEKPLFGFFVAEVDAEILGMALYYYRYSTWKGKRLYLEDIIVTEKARGQNIGKKLFSEVMKKSLDDGCSGMMWQVLDWNEPAINFYKKYNASIQNEWLNCTLSAEEIETILLNEKQIAAE
jgi:GNAT superfamily N-acetyltransferase